MLVFISNSLNPQYSVPSNQIRISGIISYSKRFIIETQFITSEVMLEKNSCGVTRKKCSTRKETICVCSLFLTYVRFTACDTKHKSLSVCVRVYEVSELFYRCPPYQYGFVLQFIELWLASPIKQILQNNN